MKREGGGRRIQLEKPNTVVPLPECHGEAGGLPKTKVVHWRSSKLGRNGQFLLSPGTHVYAGSRQGGCGLSMSAEVDPRDGGPGAISSQGSFLQVLP